LGDGAQTTRYGSDGRNALFAGFSVKKKQFFRNFFPIILYGVLGVFISTAIITAGENTCHYPQIVPFDGLRNGLRNR
jgi:hypothetical protein